jgi:hypothetical protein
VCLPHAARSARGGRGGGRVGEGLAKSLDFGAHPRGRGTGGRGGRGVRCGSGCGSRVGSRAARSGSGNAGLPAATLLMIGMATWKKFPKGAPM